MNIILKDSIIYSVQSTAILGNGKLFIAGQARQVETLDTETFDVRGAMAALIAAADSNLPCVDLRPFFK